MRQEGPLRIVCVSRRVPSPTGSGGGLAAYGLGAALAMAGHEVHFAVTQPPSKWDSSQNDIAVHCLTGPGSGDPPRTDELRAILQGIAPDVVWVFHTYSWPIFAPLRGEYPHVLYSLDPEWEVELLRQRTRTPQKSLSRTVLSAVWNRRRLSQLKAKERTAFQQAGERGVVAGYTSREIRGMRNRTGIDVRLCTLAFPDWGTRGGAPAGALPRALLLGNMESIHTRYGLRYFFSEIWPAWRDQKDRPLCEVRVVGGGSLPDDFERPPEHERLRWIGFVPSIDQEWNEATALLVPVPIVQGVRSRIVESWCRGVPVIAHPSAEAGLPVMRAGVNYVGAKQPQEWITAMRQLESDSDLAASMTRNGRQTFERELSVEAGTERFEELSRLAIHRSATAASCFS